jgi:hypothetical protein
VVAVHGACNAMSNDQRFELIIIVIARLCILAILVHGHSVSGLQVNKQNCTDVDDNINK